MKKYNIMRPIIILLVAYLVYNVTLLICSSFGMSEESAESVAIIAMVVGAIAAFIRMNRNRDKHL